MKDVLVDALRYLERVPKGVATVDAERAHDSFRGRSKPLHERVKEWADQHGLEMSADNEDRTLATRYRFRKKAP